jgi:Flp pilus assembly protein TadD
MRSSGANLNCVEVATICRFQISSGGLVRDGSAAAIRFWLSMAQKGLCAALASCLLVLSQQRGHAQGQPKQEEVARISDALRGGNFEQASVLTQSALVKWPDDFRIWTLRGMALAGSGNRRSALSAYRHALNLAPTYLPALEGAAQSEFQMGHESARPYVLKVLAQRPGDPTSHAMLGVLDYRKGSCADAIMHFEKATAAIATQPQALTEYGVCLAVVKRDQDAAPVFAEALALDPSRSAARYNLALAQWNTHDNKEALATLEPLVESAPMDEDASILEAEILESEGDTSHAVELLRKLILAYPKDVDAYLRFAILSFDHASPQVGIDILNAGLGQLPREPRLYLVRGILLTQLGEFTRAADDFETAGRIDAALSFLGVAEGLVESEEHKPAEALAQFRAAAKAHPNDAYAQYLLAQALQQGGSREGSPEYEEELKAATRAGQLDPGLVAVHDLLSSIYLENGHNELAIKQSREALALDSTDQQAVYHLILALRKTDHNDEVPALLKRLVELRANSKSDEESSRKHYRLYETPEATASTSPSSP